MIAFSSISLAWLAAPSGGSASGFMNPDLWRVINLLVFLAVLVYIFRNKLRIGQVFDNRASSIVKELEQARQEKEVAQRQLAEVEARLDRLDQEVEEIRREALLEAEREQERIRQAADADAEKIRQTAAREIEGAMKAARTQLRAFVAEQSIEMAEAMIKRELRPEDNSRMLTKYVDELGEVNR